MRVFLYLGYFLPSRYFSLWLASWDLFYLLRLSLKCNIQRVFYSKIFADSHHLFLDFHYGWPVWRFRLETSFDQGDHLGIVNLRFVELHRLFSRKLPNQHFVRFILERNFISGKQLNSNTSPTPNVQGGADLFVFLETLRAHVPQSPEGLVRHKSVAWLVGGWPG